MSNPTANILAVASTLGLLAASHPVQAASLKLLDRNTIANLFTECINDGTAAALGHDNAAWQQWSYSHDSTTDGVNGVQVGGNVYEIFGLALKETEDSIFVAINGNMPLTGEDGTAAADGNIGWGDFFLNFSGKDFATASRDKDLFAVRFAGTNDSPVPAVGLYGNVAAISTTDINNGFNAIAEYNRRVREGGGVPSFGDLAGDTTYFDQNRSLNAIGSGQYLSDITYLSLADVAGIGYDSGQFGGSETIAFKFDKSAFCQDGSCEQVPEPGSVVALLVGGFGMAGLRWGRQHD